MPFRAPPPVQPVGHHSQGAGAARGRWGTAALAAALALLPAAGGAQESATVYRCGNGYQSEPCATGAPLKIRPETPSESVREEAASRAQEEAQRAGRLQQERRQREKDALRQQQREPAGLRLPEAQDDRLTDCRPWRKGQPRWSDRKREYCAQFPSKGAKRSKGSKSTETSP
ncbi:hypothetical protein [Ideonella livida]|uniref:Uncharacterized protein n=1 Tax=Ideonella livida TaxID=2707176 RepID=A0A7C9PHN2_9BURK|nr:hypothetical protein [Ideonella livida]NDY92255.1 hypothetical protein [Ideonella livida]